MQEGTIVPILSPNTVVSFVDGAGANVTRKDVTGFFMSISSVLLLLILHAALHS
jgi:hypothetical protein